MPRNSLLLITFFIFVFTSSSQAAVESIEVTSRGPVAEGTAYGAYGEYEKIVGTVTFALDPGNPENAQIADLALAADADGLVRARANFMVLQPADAEKRRGMAFLEVSNRGGKASLSYFNAATTRSRDPVTAEDLGDGFLMRQGLTVIWVGWEYDIPPGEARLSLAAPVARGEGGAPITGFVRSDWVVEEDQPFLSLGHRTMPTWYEAIERDSDVHQLTRRRGRNTAREMVPRESWRFAHCDDAGACTEGGTHIVMKGDFPAGWIYELTYKAENPVISGMGPAAIRDMASYAKYEADNPFKVAHVIGFGVSQTGRFLRHFLYQGFNTDEEGRQAFDGVLIHTAGAGRGSFNHRFAQPSRDAHRLHAFFYPTDIYPFSSAEEPNPLGGLSYGLYTIMRHADQLPKIMYTNTGYEYWGRAAALLHARYDSQGDLPLLPNERIYHLSGGQHFVESFPPGADRKIGDDVWRGLPVDFLVNLRALAARLADWAESGREPPESRYPTYADGTLVSFDRYNASMVPGIAKPAGPQTVYAADYGRRWPKGIIDNQPPVLRAEFVPPVPRADRFGNEVAGVENVALRVPLASYLPWSRKGGTYWPDEMENFRGAFVPLSKTAAEADARGDRRPPIDALYTDRADFEGKLRQAADALVGEGFLLEEDIPRVIRRNLAYWDWIFADEAAD